MIPLALSSVFIASFAFVLQMHRSLPIPYFISPIRTIPIMRLRFCFRIKGSGFLFLFLFVNSNEKEPKDATKEERCLKLGIKNSFRDDFIIFDVFAENNF